MCDMSDVSEESLLEYFYFSGGSSGRLRNADLLKTFKPFIGHPDPQLRGGLADQSITGKKKEKQQGNGKLVMLPRVVIGLTKTTVVLV